MESFIRNLKYGVGLLRKKIGFTLIVVFSIAIGASTTTTVFCWLESIILNPLPQVPESDRLVTLETKAQSGEHITSSYSDYKDYLEDCKAFTGLAAFEERPLSFESTGHTQRVWGMLVSGNFFDVLKVKPARGHFFLPEEHVDSVGGRMVAVISYSFWRSNYHSDPSVIGKTIRLNGQDLTIIGVAAQGFKGTIVGLSYDVWAPLLQQARLTGGDGGWITEREYRALHVIGRLKPKIRIEEAQAELSVISSRLASTYRETNAGMSASLFSLEKAPDGAQYLLAPFLKILFLASLVVIVIVCANLANLFLERATEREKEISIRMALGASRSRIFGQLMTEGLVFSLFAAVLTIVFTFRLSAVLQFFVPPVNLPVSVDPILDPKVLLFAFALSIAAGLAAGVVPALSSLGVELGTSLKESSRSVSSSRGKQRLRQGLVISEVALAVVALVGAGEFVSGFRNVASIDPGFDYRHVLLVALTPSGSNYKASQLHTFYRQTAERIKGLPSVRAVSYAELVPMGLKGGSWEPLKVAGYVPSASENMSIYRNLVDSDYFEVMRIPLLDGRFFNSRDDRTAPAVAIVNTTFVKKFIVGENPVGRHFRGWGRDLRIVGVVKDSKYVNGTEPPMPYFYAPFEQFATAGTEMTLHIATDGPPEAVLTAVRRELESIGSVAYISYAMPLKDYISAAVFKQKMAASLLSVLGMTCLFLAALGIYGVMSHSVMQRTNEIGIRMALGASDTNILKMVLAQGVRIVGIGIVIGLLPSLVLSRLLTVFLYGVKAMDPVTFVGVSVLIMTVALIASGIPAYTAGKMDPNQALHLS